MWAGLARKCGLVERAKLIVAASEACADMLYATRFRAPDAFVFVETQGRTAILLSDLEVDRGRREAKVDSVVSYSEVEKKAQGIRKQKPAYAKVVAEFLKHLGVRRILTPADFPLGRCARSEEGRDSGSACDWLILAATRNQEAGGDQGSRRGSAHNGGGDGARDTTS